MKRKSLPVLQNIEITGVAAEGNAISRIDNKVLFVPYVMPGDVIDVQITRKKSSYLEGRMLSLNKPSTSRIEPFCEHFGICGGCKWQHIPYAEQLKYKEQQVVDAFQRIGKINPGIIHPIIGSQNQIEYRNKLEYTFSDRRWLTSEELNDKSIIKNNGLGFHIPGMFDKVLDINTCHLQPMLSNHIRLAVKEFALNHNLTFNNIRGQVGILRNLIVRNNIQGEYMVILVVREFDPIVLEPLLNFILNQFPEIKSLYYAVNSKVNDTLEGIEPVLYSGDATITEFLGEMKFFISPKSFFQTNSSQAKILYDITLRFAELNGNEVVYDLYTGTGTIANFLANKCSKVIGIEYIEDAIHDARINSEINHIGNTIFIAGDMKDVLQDSIFKIYGKPDVIVIDPPRAGMHPDVVKTILEASPKKIIYVSCNPATQARDIALLSESYEIREIQPVDMFPHTHHVENIAHLIRKN